MFNSSRNLSDYHRFVIKNYYFTMFLICIGMLLLTIFLPDWTKNHDDATGADIFILSILAIIWIAISWGGRLSIKEDKDSKKYYIPLWFPIVCTIFAVFFVLIKSTNNVLVYVYALGIGLAITFIICFYLWQPTSKKHNVYVLEDD